MSSTARASLLLHRETELVQLHAARRRISAWLRAFQSMGPSAERLAPGELFDRWVREMISALRFQAAAVYVRRGDGLELVRGQAGWPLAERVACLPSAESGLDNGQPDQPPSAIPRCIGLDRALWFFGGDAPSGQHLLVAGYRAESARFHSLLSEDDHTYFRLLGRQVAAMLGNALLLERLEHERNELAARSEALAEANRELCAARQVAEELARVAERAGEAKAAFLANMSHEIRTPMNGIVAMAELLDASELTLAQRESAEIIHLSARNLLGIINDILDFSKIESGKLELEAVDFDPRALVEECSTMAAAQLRGKELALVTDVEADVPARVRGDPGRLRQVLLNLLNNAVKFTAQGEVAVQVVLRRAEPDQVELAFAVKDSGVGIDPAAQGLLFQPFAQADASTTRRFGGTGLGLAISKRLVRAMGGDITLKSAPGEGSTFTVTVPLVAPEGGLCAPRWPQLSGLEVLLFLRSPSHAALVAGWITAAGGRATIARTLADVQVGAGAAVVDAGESALEPLLAALGAAGGARVVVVGRSPADALALPAGVARLSQPLRQSALLSWLAGQEGQPGSGSRAASPPRFDGMRVLVAEDSVVNQLVVQRLLERLGVRPIVVANGQETLRALEEHPVDLVFMDCQMPVMDGYQATRALREREPAGRRLPIYALTASALPGDRERCAAAGMDGCLTKPVRLTDLADALDRARGR